MPGRFPALPVLMRPSKLIAGLLSVAVICSAIPPVLAQEAYAPPRSTNESEKDWNRKNIINFQRATRSTAPSQSEREVLASGAKMFVDRLTNPDNSTRLVTLTDQLLNTYIYGPTTSTAARAILHTEVVNRARELLTEDPPHPPIAAINLVTMLGRLIARSANAANNTPAVPLVAANVPLRAVLLSPKINLHAKIPAVRSLGNIGLNSVQGVQEGDLSITARDAIVADLVKALAAADAQGQDDGSRWYREVLVEAIGNCNLANTLAGSSAPIDALVGRLTDPKEHLKVRAAAARAISQMDLAGINVQLIIHESAVVTYRLGVDFNARTEKQRTGSDKWAAWYLYHAFMSQSAAQAAKGWGFNHLAAKGLATDAKFAAAAYAAIKGIPVTLLNAPANSLPAAIADKDIASALTWINANVPMNRKATPGSPAIPTPASRGEIGDPNPAAGTDPRTPVGEQNGNPSKPAVGAATPVRG